MLTSTDWQVRTFQQSHTNVHLVVHTQVFLTVQAYPHVWQSQLCTSTPEHTSHCN